MAGSEGDGQDELTLEQLEALRLRAEIEKLKAEASALRRPPFLRPSSWVPLLAATAGLVTAVGQWRRSEANLVVAQQQVDSAEVRETAAQSYAAGLQTRTDTVLGGGEAMLPRRVSIQFQGRLSRDLMTELQNDLNARGMPAPRPERLDGDFGNEVRYFFRDDTQIADDVANVVRSFFADKRCPIDLRVRPMLDLFDNVTPGNLEVWIRRDCSNP